MMSNEVVKTLSVFPDNTLIFIDDGIDTFPIFDVSSKMDRCYLQSGWAPYSSLPGRTQDEALCVKSMINKLSACQDSKVICLIQGDCFDIDSIAPSFATAESSGIHCVIKAIK